MAGSVVIFAGGTGNPFFTTDTTAALRAAEMGCDVIMKATQVDGIYSADPKLDPDAARYDRLTYDEALARNLKVMDGAAFALARDSRIPIVVFSIEAARQYRAGSGGPDRLDASNRLEHDLQSRVPAKTAMDTGFARQIMLGRKMEPSPFA